MVFDLLLGYRLLATAADVNGASGFVTVWVNSLRLDKAHRVALSRSTRLGDGCRSTRYKTGTEAGQYFHVP